MVQFTVFLSALVACRDLYVANYAGSVVSFTLEESNSQYSLKEVASTLECGTNPGWIEIDQGNLLRLNEAYVGALPKTTNTI